jgi:TctA family transporter
VDRLILTVPVAPCAASLILRPMAEHQFHRALAISQGAPLAALLLVAAALVSGPMLLCWRNRQKGAVGHEAV